MEPASTRSRKAKQDSPQGGHSPTSSGSRKGIGFDSFSSDHSSVHGTRKDIGFESFSSDYSLDRSVQGSPFKSEEMEEDPHTVKESPKQQDKREPSSMYPKVPSPDRRPTPGKKPEGRTQREDDQSGNINEGGFIYFLCACLLMLVLAAAYMLIGKGDEMKEDTAMIERRDSYLKALEQLRGVMGHQEETSWKRLRAVGRHMFNDTVKEPAVLPVLIPPGSSDLAECFIARFKEMACKHLNCREPMVHRDGNLDEHVETALKDGGSLWILRDFEAISNQEAMMFLTLADHENAKFKRAIIMIMLEAQKPPKRGLKGFQIDEAIEETIDKSLQQKMRQDKIRAVVARLSGYGIILREDPDIRQRGCPSIGG